MTITDIAGGLLIMCTIIFIFMVPFFATGGEVILLIFSLRSPEDSSKVKKTLYLLADMFVILAAVSLELFYLGMTNVMFDADWMTQLYNDQRHSPIFPGSMPTVLAILILSLVGFLILSIIDVNKTPPLVTVLAMSALYAGLIFSVVFTFHVIDLVYDEILDLYLLLPPLNFLLMSFRVICRIIKEYRFPEEKAGISRRVLNDARKWPVIALLLMLPLLGVLFCIMMLFGQTPDAAIRAFTDTADFRLSQMTAPQNLYYDEHYLCTVAAGGDPEIVHPLRMGVRHGHKVIVNRQLCIANAFEQILEERTPRLHRTVRSFYDAYGFPLAKLIRSKKEADIVYILMKPLEWFFLIVLYLTDVHPEDRIAMQYTGHTAEEVMSRHDA